jgi:hypothetical protein
MTENLDPIQLFWDNLLSRNPARIKSAFSTLDEDSKQAVIEHLKKMISETGWHPEQVKSAQIAINILQHNKHNEL